MSMKRTKAKSTGAKKATEKDAWAKKPEVEKTWEEQVDGKADDKFTPYALAATFKKGQLVMHPKFGKGAISGVDGTRIEILFQDGKKKLGHATAASA